MVSAKELQRFTPGHRSLYKLDENNMSPYDVSPKSPYLGPGEPHVPTKSI